MTPRQRQVMAEVATGDDYGTIGKRPPYDVTVHYRPPDFD